MPGPYTYDEAYPKNAELVRSATSGVAMFRADKLAMKTAFAEEHLFATSGSHRKNAARINYLASVTVAPLGSATSGMCSQGMLMQLRDTRELLYSGYDAFNGKTATFTNGSAIVTGAATAFLTTVEKGGYAVLDADGATRFLKILSVDSNTQLTLVSNYAGAAVAPGAFTILNPLGILPVESIHNTDIFGDGSDGAATIGANTAVTANRQYTNLTIDAGFTLTYGNASFVPVLRVSGTLTVNGILRALQSSTGGGWGGSGGGGGSDNAVTNGSIGIGQINACRSFIGASNQSNLTLGNGGAAGVAAGGNGGAGTASQLTSYKNLLPFYLLPAGSPGGAGSGGAAGGSGSLGLIIFARTIVVGAAGIIHADGAAGVAGAGNDGGGGGGGGGVLDLVYQSLTNGGTIRANGGAFGAKAGAGGDGGVGGAGIVISDEI